MSACALSYLNSATSCVCRHKWAKAGLMSGSNTCLSPESTCWANFDPFRASCHEFKGSERANERLEGHRWEMPPEECMLLFHWFYGNMHHNDTVKVGFHLTSNQTGRKWDGDSHCFSVFSRRSSGKRWRVGEGGRKEKRCFNLLIPSLPIRPCIKQITQTAPLHTSVSLPISPFLETLGK